MRLRSSYLIAGGVALVLAGWLASGQLEADLAEHEPPVETVDAAEVAVPVRVRDSTAMAIPREILVSARTAAKREVEIRAETSGRVVAVGPERGSRVEAGETLVRLDPRERAAMVRKAEATLRQRQLEFEAATKLGEKGFQAETRVAEAAAVLEASRAELELARSTLDHTTIEAPFAGVLEGRPVEVGDFVDIGDPVALVVEQDPFLVTGDLAESEIGGVEVGMPGTAELASGRTVEGRISYLASRADPSTRTFAVELEVANPDRRFTAGMSAELHIELEEVMAHAVPASVLTLDDRGVLGIKVAEETGRVRFLAAEILRADGERVWLAGLPERIRVITVGQGFVDEGSRIRAVPEGRDGEASPLVAERRS